MILTYRDLAFILSLGGEVDWVALSFVQTPQDMIEFRQLAGDSIRLMAKLEKPSAIDFLDEVYTTWFLSFFLLCTLPLLSSGCSIAVSFSPPCFIFPISSHLSLEINTQIVALSDGVMVARGDLGVEMNPWDVPVLQKRIVETCKTHGKPVVS